jgi:pyruvate,water dikinase
VSDEPAVLWLDAIAETDRPRVGAKAFVLARLRQQGFPVPDGFVLPAATPVGAAAAAYARLGGAVAVRSSSTAEDTADASFAGQYRTVLGVVGEDALREAVRLCRESAGAATAYAQALGAAAGSMAVLVQRMAAPQAAGVVFTEDPRDPTALLVEAHPGLGEAVVSGSKTPDRYVLDRTSGAFRDDGRPGAGCLDEPGLRAVVSLARRVEAILGAPQDVEWALESEGPVLLQARPITVEADEQARPERHLRRLTRANVGEVLPDPVTPLTWSTVGTFLEHGFRGVAEEAGLVPAGTGPFLVLYRRRLYMNLSLCVDVARRLPGVTAADAERLILGGGASGAPPPLTALPLIFALPRLARVGLRLLGLARRLPARVLEAEAAVRGLPGREVLEHAGPESLARYLDAFAQRGGELAFTHVGASGSCGFRLALLGALLGRLAPGDIEGRVNRLVTGLPDVASTAPTFALEALAEDVGRHEGWASWLKRAAGRPSAVGVLADAPPVLAARLRGFLDRFGHRAVSEGELAAPAWEDDPRPVLAALAALAEGERAAEWSRSARAEVRRADEEALLARLGPIRRALLRSAIHGAQDAVRERERTKSLTVALVHHGRRLARASARHLAAAGALASVDDVFFLELDELRRALRGQPPGRALVERRRRRHQREGALPAPREVDLSGAEARPESGGRGIGVSAGVAIGPARVLLPGDPLRLEPGEVLVTPVLDAAFGPILATAAGAVAEIGGLLSHGAVVARELGVPCVVDVRGATRRFRTGDRLVVDGSAGTVEVEAGSGAVEGAAAVSAGATGPGAERTASPALLDAEDTSRESLHALERHPQARESVYLNVQDPATGLVLVASAGVRPGGRGESLLAIGDCTTGVLFGLDRAPAQADADGFAVAGQRVTWHPFRFRAQARLARHEAAGFPGPVLGLLLEPRTVEIEIDLTLEPTTPAVDYCRGLPVDTLTTLAPLGAHHLEQSGAWRGVVAIDGRSVAVDGTGSRDHSWGRRSWEAADHWRLFSVRFGPDLAVHALAVSACGRLVEGGFVWRGGRAERITRVQYVTEREGPAVRAFDLRVTTAAGPPLRLRGTVVRTIVVPVDVERRPGRHLLGRPYRLVLHENFTRYEAAGRVGHGMAELTERPLPENR